jgi:hypothetical protein
MKIFGKLSNTILTSSGDFRLLGSHPAAGFRWLYGGGRRIRTSEVYDDRFTVCSLWPLGNPSRETVLYPFKFNAFAGAGDGTRTRNLLITSQLLYQLSYASTCFFYRENRICLFIETRRQSQALFLICKKIIPVHHVTGTIPQPVSTPIRRRSAWGQGRFSSFSMQPPRSGAPAPGRWKSGSRSPEGSWARRR